MQKAKDQKLIRHICCSFHDNNEALRNIIDTGYVDSITLQYNILDRSLEDGIAYAHQKHLGIVVMGPVGGGRLGANSDVLASLIPGIGRVPELALRFVLANSNVTVALSGMSTMQHVEENVKVASDPRSLDVGERAMIQQHVDRLRSMADLYCTGCAYCKPCPNNVDISGVFGIYNQARVYGLWDQSKKRYAELVKKGAAADLCVQCGECEEKCPQNLPIRQQLEESHKALVS
jgi:predicted aldo/keto reductase-like oxidoreductase